MNVLFYIPYLYIIRTRLKANGRLFSFILILVLPPIYFATVLQSSFSILHLIESILGLLLIQNFYEIGYIQNDTETIKKEQNPTLRLDKASLSYYEANKLRIYVTRIFFAIIISLILLILMKFSFDSFIFLISAYLLIPLYYIYNTIRSFVNLILHFILTTIKYSAIQLLFFSTASFKIFLFSLLAYPIINFIDRAATPRFFYTLSKYYKFNEFRVFYYFVLFLFSIVFVLNKYINYKEFYVFAYYFIYRLAIIIGVKMKKILRN